MRKAELTIIIQKDNKMGLFVGQIEEFPSVISQGETMEELQDNLKDALKMILQLQKEQLEKEYANKKISKIKLTFS